MASPAEKLDLSAVSGPEPEPLFLEPGKQHSYPVEVMPRTAAMATWATSRLSYVPESLAAQSVLAAMSLAVQAHFDIKLPTRQVRPCSLHLVTVAESGDRKSTSDDRVLTAIRNYESQLEEQFRTQKADAALQQSAWDEAKREATNRNKKSGKEALLQAYRDLGPRPEGPVEPTLIVRQGTTQGLLKRFLTARPSLGLMSDEGGSWLGGYGMNEDNRLATIATLSDFWDGKTVQMMTSGEGFTALRGKRLTFHLMIQPVLSASLLGDALTQGQGFLSRLLVSQPESLAGTRIVDPTKLADAQDLRALEDFDERLGQIVAAQMPVKDGTLELEPRILEMDDEAQQAWWTFYNAIEVRLGPDGDLGSVKGFVGKLPEMAARIATVLAVFEQGIRIECLTRDDLRRGIVIAEFYLTEALRLFGVQAAPAVYKEAQEVSQWLRDKWPENLVTVTALSKNGPKVVRNQSDRIRAIFEILERHNHIAGPLNDQMVSGRKVRTAWRVLARHD